MRAGATLGLVAALALAGSRRALAAAAGASTQSQRSSATLPGWMKGKRSLYMAFSDPRKCVLCEWVVEMVDRKLQQNPYVEWTPLSDYVDGEAGGSAGPDARRPKYKPHKPPAGAPAAVPMPPPWRKPPADPSEPATVDEVSSDESTQVGSRFSAKRSATPEVSLLEAAASKRRREPDWNERDSRSEYNADMASRRRALARTKEMATRMHQRATSAGKDTMPDIALPPGLAQSFSLGRREVPAGPLDLDGTPHGHERLEKKSVPETKGGGGMLGFLGRFLELEGRAAQAAPVVSHAPPQFLETGSIDAARATAAVDAATGGMSAAESALHVDEAVRAAVRRVHRARAMAHEAARRAGGRGQSADAIDDAAEAASRHPSGPSSLLQSGGFAHEAASFRIGDHLGALETPALDRADGQARADAAAFARRHPSVVGGREPAPGVADGSVAREQARFRSLLGLGPAAAAAGGPSGAAADAPPVMAGADAVPGQEDFLRDVAAAFAPPAQPAAPAFPAPPAQAPAPQPQAYPPPGSAAAPPAPGVPPLPQPLPQEDARFRASAGARGFPDILGGLSDAASAAGRPAPSKVRGLAAQIGKIRTAIERAGPGDGSAPGSEAGDSDSGYLNVNQFPSDPEDAAYRPDVVTGASPHFGTGKDDIVRGVGRSMAASREAGRWSATDQGRPGVPDPAALNYAAAAPIPQVTHRVSAREHARLVYRLDKTARFFETYHHIMDALEDVCEGQLPRETGKQCTNVYARVQKLTMWMMHGYQPDEICVKMYLCKVKYFEDD